jgi:hypothetical protein
MSFKTIASATALVALLATPALSQTTPKMDTAPAPASADMGGMKATTGTKMKTERHHRRHMGRMEHHHRHHVNRHAMLRDRDVGPGEVAAGIVGGAVGTAAAIATAPFGMWNHDSYAYYGDGYAPQTQPYMFDDNGPSCRVGTWTTINGQRLPCQ